VARELRVLEEPPGLPPHRQIGPGCVEKEKKTRVRSGPTSRFKAAGGVGYEQWFI
jgi:hypothetical protein